MSTVTYFGTQQYLVGKPLTEREIEIVRLLSRGYSNKEIAVALDIRPSTVKTHLGRIFPKLAVTNRTSAAIEAIKKGLIGMPKGVDHG
jgi:DNA-binding NarL/FixJ family response regulator